MAADRLAEPKREEGGAPAREGAEDDFPAFAGESAATGEQRVSDEEWHKQHYGGAWHKGDYEKNKELAVEALRKQAAGAEAWREPVIRWSRRDIIRERREDKRRREAWEEAGGQGDWRAENPLVKKAERREDLRKRQNWRKNNGRGWRKESPLVSIYEQQAQDLEGETLADFRRRNEARVAESERLLQDSSEPDHIKKPQVERGYGNGIVSSENDGSAEEGEKIKYRHIWVPEFVKPFTVKERNFQPDGFYITPETGEVVLTMQEVVEGEDPGKKFEMGFDSMGDPRLTEMLRTPDIQSWDAAQNKDGKRSYEETQEAMEYIYARQQEWMKEGGMDVLSVNSMVDEMIIKKQEIPKKVIEKEIRTLVTYDQEKDEFSVGLGDKRAGEATGIFEAVKELRTAMERGEENPTESLESYIPWFFGEDDTIPVYSADRREGEDDFQYGRRVGMGKVSYGLYVGRKGGTNTYGHEGIMVSVGKNVYPVTV